MDILLKELTSKCDLLPPISEKELKQLLLFAPDLPLELIQIFKHHKGMNGCSGLPMRLMPPMEVLETAEQFKLTENEYFNNGFEKILLWTDDNSNYAGIFTNSELRGKIFFLDHEEPADFPDFKNTKSFYTALLTLLCYEGCPVKVDTERKVMKCRQGTLQATG